MRDLRYALRVLRKSPVFTITATLTLALCIGANTAIYSVVDRVLLRPLPYPRPDRLAVVVRHYQGAGSEDDVSQAGVTWVALREGASKLDVASLSGLGMGVNLVAGGQAEYVMQQRVSAGYFRVLGVAPALGREFSDDEDRPNGPSAVILSDRLWTHAFHADPGIVGRSVVLRGEPHTVVGVMPPGFTPLGFLGGEAIDAWTPLRPSTRGEGGGENYAVIARLKDGVSWAEASAQVASTTASIVRQRYGRSRFPVSMGVTPLQYGLTAESRRPLLVLWAAVGAVLLIGCVNVAGLLLARSRARAPEIAMRMALGGARTAIVRQLLVESVVLAAFGGIAGILLGYIGSRSSAAWLEAAFGVTGAVGLDGRVLAITAVVALGTSVLFGLAPAVHATRVDLRETLIESGTTSIAGSARAWPRRALVVVEVMLGVVLLVGAGLLLRTFQHLVTLRGGFDGTNVLTATFSLQDARYRDAGRVQQLFDRTTAGMHEIAGVEHAAVALTLPFERALNDGFRFVGGDPQGRMVNVTYVTPEYFETLRIPIRRGRAFTAADTATSDQVIVVNETFVRRYSPDVDPLGRQVASGGATRTIVGIVGDIQQKTSFGNFGPIAPTPAAFVPAAQLAGGYFAQVHTWFSPSWIVRLAAPQGGAGKSMARQMETAVRNVDPLLPFAKVRTLDDVRGEAVATERAQAMLLGTLAGLALMLAAVGLYGLVASSVAERTRELGIRIALGASRSRTIAAAAVPGFVLAAIGVGVGLLVARAGATVMQSLVFGVSIHDPLTFALAGGIVFGVAAVATLVPAMRIVRLNPIRALRTM
jgi:putative ABC transport system permease protein